MCKTKQSKEIKETKTLKTNIKIEKKSFDAFFKKMIETKPLPEKDLKKSKKK